MKAKKAMKASKIARGKLARVVVFRGSKEQTGGGMTKDQLVKNKSGRVVSKAASARAKKAYATSPLKKWMEALKAARKQLNVSGFVACGGKTAQLHRGRCCAPRPKASPWASDVRGKCFHAAELCGHATWLERGIFPRASDDLCMCHDAL